MIVPGQGPPFRDKAYLDLTGNLYASILDQVHAALARGIIAPDEVRAAVNVDSIRRRYPGGAEPSEDFRAVVSALVRKTMQESLDGATGAVATPIY